jgi:hypothetical protein
MSDNNDTTGDELSLSSSLGSNDTTDDELSLKKQYKREKEIWKEFEEKEEKEEDKNESK